MLHRFQSQTDNAAFDIDINIFFENRPIIFLTYKFLDFIDIKMAYQRVVVELADELSSNDLWHKKYPLVMQYSIDFFISIQTFNPDFSNLRIWFLQL